MTKLIVTFRNFVTASKSHLVAFLMKIKFG